MNLGIWIVSYNNVKNTGILKTAPTAAGFALSDVGFVAEP